MGNFYMTVTVADVPQAAIVEETRELRTFVGPTMGRYTVMYPDMMQFASPDLHNVWANLSKTLNATILVSSVYDDDVLYYELWKSGAIVDQYVSDPSAMGEDGQESTPHGGNAEMLCAVFHCGDQEKLKEMLSVPSAAEKYVFETERHKDIVKELALPISSVGYSFTYIEQGEIPPGVTISQLIKLPKE